MKRLFLFSLLIILTIISHSFSAPPQKENSAKGASNRIGSPQQNAFSVFWKEFQSAIEKNDKEKVADMTEFPLGGDDFVFNAEDGKRIYSNDKLGFVAYAYDRIFNKTLARRLKKVKAMQSGKLEKYYDYKFTPYSELERDGFLPSFIERGAEGWQLTISKNAPDDESAVSLFFTNVKGVYKFYGIRYAG